jgi:HK97 family phage prohead protease
MSREDQQAELLRIGVGGVVPVTWDVGAKSDPGTLTGWASVYNVIDQQDDVVVPGAFRKTIADWRAAKSRRVIPLTLDHQNSAEGVIGSLTDAEDTAYGLKTTFSFASTAKAQDARALAREGHLNGLSIFGPIFSKGQTQFAGKMIRTLREVGLTFVGLTPIPANTDALVLTAKAVSNTPWSNFSQADYTDEQWARACLIDTGEGEGKQRYKLPVKEPSGTVNRNGVHAAAARLNQVQVSSEKRATAARALVRMYGEMDEEPPDSLRRMAGMMAAASLDFGQFSDAMRKALDIPHDAARKAAVDVLLGSYQSSEPITAEPSLEESAAVEAVEDIAVDADAAEYALAFAGMTGPENPPGDEPTDSLVDPLASLDAQQTSSELEVLLASFEPEE